MHTTLISTADLAGRLNEPGWIVCDCRHDLMFTGAGRRAYRKAHVPGARFLHLDDDLCGAKTGRNGRHPLPEPLVMAERLGALGIDNRSQVVAYDAKEGYYAARLWWTLRWLGHDAVAVLDGGWDAWLKAAHPISDRVPVTKAARFTVRIRSETVFDARSILATIGKPGPLLLDARSPDRFRGENKMFDPVGGHIPGAVNRLFRLNLEAAGGFKPPAALKQEFEAILGAIPPSRVVHYCGSGVTACHNLLAMEIAGLPGSRLYPGSWSEWSSDPSRPVAKD